MNLFEICMQVLNDASEGGLDFDKDTDRENIANDIYELYYESSKLINQNTYPNSGYFIDVKDYYSDDISHTRFVNADED